MRIVGFPRFLGEALALPFEAELIVDGPVRTRPYGADLKQEWVSEVAGLCDGTRTVAQLCLALPHIPRPSIERALRLFHEARVLTTEATASPAGTPAETPVEAFVRRFATEHGCEISATSLLRRLAVTEVLISGDAATGPQQQCLQDCLRNCGLRSVALWDARSGIIAGKRTVTRPTVLVAVAREQQAELLRDLSSTAQELGMAWFPIVLEGAEPWTNVGPLLLPGRACLRCWWTSRSFVADGDEQHQPERDAEAWHSTAALAAMDLVSAVLGISERFCLGRARRIEETTGMSQELLRPVLPLCPDCAPDRTGERDLPVSVLDVELAVRRSHKNPLRFSGSPAEAARLVVRPSHAKSLTHSRVVPLSAEIGTSAAESQDVCSLASLAGVLRQALGSGSSLRTGGPMARANATAGGLGSVEVFVVARAVTDLDPGYYLYEPHLDRLAKLERRCGTTPVDRFLAGLGVEGSPADVSALLILTGALWRLRPKYGVFGCRLFQFDAGVARSQLAISAQASALMTRALPAWPDDFIEQELNLRSVDEQVTGVLAVGCPVMRVDPPSPARFAPATPTDQSFHAGYDEQQLVERLYAATRTYGPIAAAPSSALLGMDDPSETAVAGTDFSAMGPLAAALSRRRSVRRFASVSPHRHTVEAVLRDGHRAWRALESQAAGDLAVLVLSGSIQGVDPAVYRFDPRSDSLAKHALMPEARVSRRLYTQAEFAEAPFALWIVGDLSATTRHTGAHGYRTLLSMAGALANCLWLQAIALDLDGCLVAGLIHGEATLRLALNPQTQVPLLAVALGYRSS